MNYLALLRLLDSLRRRLELDGHVDLPPGRLHLDHVIIADCPTIKGLIFIELRPSR